MIIRVIPETDEERAKTEEATIVNVKEFFLFGNHVTEDGHFNDFHEWTGSYRYLMGTLLYYYEEINDERAEARNAQKRRQFAPPSIMPQPSIRTIVDPVDIPSESEPKDDGEDAVEE